MYIDSLKFSLWCDFIERSFLDGEFLNLLERRVVNGATSNPAIFKSAILTSQAYRDDIESLKGRNPKEIYEALAIKDIKKAAQRLLPLYEKDDDGFISIEVDPFLCDDAQGTIEEGKRLYREIDMPNVMVKVPATKAGYEAMEALVAEGINVNATLIFSVEQAKKCLDAFSRGIGRVVVQKLPKAVISVFVSRFDRKLDDRLFASGLETSKVGIYNAMKVYRLIEGYGLKNVRTLFASTGVKGDNLPADYYIEKLLLPNSINTAPLDTIRSFVDSDRVDGAVKIDEFIDDYFDRVKRSGIDIDSVCDDLMREGLDSFKEAFREILDSI